MGDSITRIPWATDVAFMKIDGLFFICASHLSTYLNIRITDQFNKEEEYFSFGFSAIFERVRAEICHTQNAFIV